MTQPLLSASNILDAPDLAEEYVPVPEWPDPVTKEPGVIRLMQLNAEDSMALTREMSDIKNEDLGMFIVLVRCARDADGLPIFTDEDIIKLKKKSMKVLNRLQLKALQLNALDKRVEVTLKKD